MGVGARSRLTEYVWGSGAAARLTTPHTTYKQNMLCCRITTSSHTNTHILIQWFWLGTHELPDDDDDDDDDDQLLIETCRSVFKCFSVWHFKLMFYYTEVHLLAHYIQWIKMHGETVKLNFICFNNVWTNTVLQEGVPMILTVTYVVSHLQINSLLCILLVSFETQLVMVSSTTETCWWSSICKENHFTKVRSLFHYREYTHCKVAFDTKAW
jgi:hypothetical protein